MANCPKCGHKLKITDISQYCPKCKVNMVFYGFAENFYREAKTAELSQAGISCKIRRLKYAFIGSKLTIARLIVMLLPAAALLIPAGKAMISLPYKESGFDFGILGLVSLFTGDDLNYLLSMCSAELGGAAFAALRNALFGFLGVALFAVFALLFSVLCFLSIKNMQKITSVIAGLGIAACVADMVLINIFVKAAAKSDILSGSNGFGLIVVALMFGAVLAVNLILSIKGIAVEYNEGMVERAEIYKKVKSGELNIEDLPYPVVETAETRKILEEIEEQRAKYEKKHTEKEAEAQ